MLTEPLPAYFNPSKLPQPTAGQLLSRVAVTRPTELFFFSGFLAAQDEETGARLLIDDQVLHVFEKIHNALKAVDLSMRNIVQMTTFIVGVENTEAFRKARIKAYAGLYPEREYPPNTVIVVDHLGRIGAGVLVEIQIIASRESPPD